MALAIIPKESLTLKGLLQAFTLFGLSYLVNLIEYEQKGSVLGFVEDHRSKE